jgi:aminoglycoside 6'-N-acetyltransferase I
MSKVRRVEPRDRDEWSRMRIRLWPEEPPEVLRREVENYVEKEREAVFVVERLEGGLCGFLEASLRDVAEGCRSSPVGYIEGWYVDPDMRRRGIGRALVVAAEAWASGHGCTEMGSDAYLDNETSHRAHAALGYEEIERLVHFRKGLAG